MNQDHAAQVFRATNGRRNSQKNTTAILHGGSGRGSTARTAP